MELKITINITDGKELEKVIHVVRELKELLELVDQKGAVEVKTEAPKAKTSVEPEIAPSAPKSAKSSKEEPLLEEAVVPSIPTEAIIDIKPATAEDARIAVNAARAKGVNVELIKDLISNKYSSTNVSSIPEPQLALFIRDVEALPIEN